MTERLGEHGTIVAPLEALFRAHYVGLVRLSMAFGMARAEAEEAVQDTFVAFARHVDAVGRGNELAYLRRSTINASLGRHRRARRVRMDPLDAVHESIGVPDESESVGGRAAVRDAVRRLPPRQRSCVVLRYFEGLADAEIADVLDISTGSVKTHLSRARDSLREFLEDDDGR